MAQETQYCSFRYIFGTEYSLKTEASEISPAQCVNMVVLSSLSVLRLHTNSCGFDHVSNCESLDRLVLWCAARAVGASDRLDVAAALLVASTAQY